MDELVKEFLEDIKTAKDRIRYTSRGIADYLHDREALENMHNAYLLLIKVEERLRRVYNG